MKNFVSLIFLLSLLYAPVKLQGQEGTVKKKTVEKATLKNEDPKKISEGSLKKHETEHKIRVPSHVPLEEPTITTAPTRTEYKRGFRVSGTAFAGNKVEVYLRAKWKKNGEQNSNNREAMLVNVDDQSKWTAKMMEPYLEVPDLAYAIEFVVFAKQIAEDSRVSNSTSTTVKGIMEPPTITGSEKQNIYIDTGAYAPGGLPGPSSAVILGKGIPGLTAQVSVAVEYQTPKQRYNSGEPDMRTVTVEGTTKVTSIDQSGNWSIKMDLPSSIPDESYGRYYSKLVVKAVQFDDSTDASEEAEKKLDVVIQ